MRILHIVTSLLVEGVLLPFRGLDPIWGLAALSLLSGLGFLYIFKWTSNQEAIRRAKEKVKARLLEMRLFRHDPVLSLRAFGGVLWENVGYLRHSVRPMLFLIPPVVLLLMQLYVRYEMRPLASGESTLLRVVLEESSAGEPVELELPPGLALEIPPLRIPTLGETNWRLAAHEPGAHEVVLRIGAEDVRTPIHVGGTLPALSPTRSRGGWLAALAAPSEPPLPRGQPVASVSVDYPRRQLEVFGFGVHWLVVFLLLSVVPAYLVKGLLGVEA